MKAQATVRRHVEPVLVTRSTPARGRTVPAGVGFIGDLLLAVLPPVIEAGGAVGTAYVGGRMTQQQLKTKLEGERELIHATGASQLALARQQQSAAGDQLDFLKALAVPALIGFGLYLVFK